MKEQEYTCAPEKGDQAEKAVHVDTESSQKKEKGGDRKSTVRQSIYGMTYKRGKCEQEDSL
jgi:hypothetical protein